MRLIRLRIATALLCGAGIVAGVIAGPDLTENRVTGKPGSHTAGSILLASLAGLAICFVWIAATWRAWG